MYEDNQEIYDFLPIEAGAENLYIQHLFGAFQAVNEKEEPTKVLRKNKLFNYSVRIFYNSILRGNHRV